MDREPRALTVVDPATMERERLISDIRELEGPESAEMFQDFPIEALRVHADWLRKGSPSSRAERDVFMERERLLGDLEILEGKDGLKAFGDMPLPVLRAHVEWLRAGKPMERANKMQPRGWGWQRIEEK